MHPPTQLSRCFIQPIEDPPETKGGSTKRKRRTWRDEIPKSIIELLRPWAHPCLVWDVETTTDAKTGQRAKVLFWQNRGLKYEDRCNLFAQGRLTPEAHEILWQEGVAFSPTHVPPSNSSGSRHTRITTIWYVWRYQISSATCFTGRPG